MVFRDRAFSVKRTEIGIAQPPSECPAWGIVMEMGFPNGMVALLLALADGTSSMYFSSGAVVIGGHAHENIRQAAAAFLATANQLQRSMKRTQTSPSPAMGHVAFHARTDEGLLTADVEESELMAGRHPLSPLFIAGHSVIAEPTELVRNYSLTCDTKAWVIETLGRAATLLAAIVSGLFLKGIVKRGASRIEGRTGPA